MPKKKNTLQSELIPSPQPSPEDGRGSDALAHLRRPLTKDDLDKVRHIEGFPLGADEDIIALSDPPYYTACPNPFLEDFIRAYSKPYNEATDTYHREPFAADVSEGKNDPIYNAHSYHTKVPHKAIMRYILHYTEPGDVVFDGFCGTGMTGVAAQLCGSPDPEFKAQIEAEMPGVKWGARRAVLCDLSPAATFIAYNYNMPVDVAEFEREAKRIREEMEAECGWLYETLHTDGKTKGRINYTVWSDVFTCPECGGELVFWEAAVDKEAGAVRDKFPCPQCGVDLSKRSMERALVAYFDRAINQTIRLGKQTPVLINYSVGNKRYEKTPAASDLSLVDKIEQSDIHDWFPIYRMPEGDESRRNDDIGLTHAHHFYTRRNLWALAKLWQRIDSAKVSVRNSLRFCFTANLRSVTKLASIAFSYYFHGGGGPINAGTKGTLYVSSTIPEVNVIQAFDGRAATFAKLFRQSSSRALSSEGAMISLQSSSSLLFLSEDVVDYIFVDPPFGGNLMYAELSFYWEAWLRIVTNSRAEAVVNKTQQKGLSEYQRLMEQCFQEAYRVLKPGHWMTVEFHNSQNRVWNAIQEALQRVGFVVADVRTLDKQQGSFKQYNNASAVKQDLVISAYKPSRQFEQRFLEEAGTDQGAWDFLRQHLRQLPVFVEKDGAVEIIAERQNYLLFDRMIAFHIQRGASVPLSAAEFYAGLRQRFPERDGMYFLTDQAAEYDKQRAMVAQVEQLSLFVSDEKSAMQWLRTQLDAERQTYQDLQPKFLQELHQARHEKMPELHQVLEENFLKDDEDRWYVPDPARAEDLEKLRERGLLKEFAAYLETKGKLKVFRTEAVRAGFKVAWAKREYQTILDVARRLPEDVLQEDSALLMYFDNAALRAGQGCGYYSASPPGPLSQNRKDDFGRGGRG